LYDQVCNLCTTTTTAVAAAIVKHCETVSFRLHRCCYN